MTPLQVTDRVSFDIHEGEFFALVGESGCGKSVTAMSILRLLPQPSAQIIEGSVNYCPTENAASVDLVKLPLAELQKVRGSEIACIFQEPMQALNPVVTIKKQLLEVFKFSAPCKSQKSARLSPERHSQSSFSCHSRLDRESPLSLIREQLALAGFKDIDRVLESYPHELSGGMLQRICIVMALLSKPKLIIADEPTTALDVTVQAQVLAVLKEMASRTGTAVLLITHKMGIVSQYADRVAVMYAGRIVETGAVRDVIDSPMHPYTQGLLAAIPENHSDMRTMKSIPGSVPHPRDFAKGCRFADRCEKCTEQCRSDELPPKQKAPGSTNHEANCFL
jgi:oligopeptide/dipeptide ABC transporter ATP-binding protein